MSNKILDDIITSRRSIKKFIEEDIPDRDVYAIIDAARYAPSNGNIQPWYFVIVKDEITKIGLSKLVDQFYNEKIKEQNNSNLREIFKSFHRNVRLKEAPINIFVFYDTTYDHLFYQHLISKLKDNKLQELWNEATKQSVAGAIQNVLLKAEEIGYSMCLIGGPYYLKEKIEEFFGLPQNYKFYSTILLGRKDEEPLTLPKKPLEDVLEFFPLNTQEIYEYMQENTDDIIKQHSLRVKEIAEKLQEKIGGDKKVIEYASLLHDIALKDGFDDHAERGASWVYEKFKMKWKKNFLEQVCDSIKFHSITSLQVTNNPNIICVYDADKIDFLSKFPMNILKLVKVNKKQIYDSIIHPFSKKLLEELKPKR